LSHDRLTGDKRKRVVQKGSKSARREKIIFFGVRKAFSNITGVTFVQILKYGLYFCVLFLSLARLYVHFAYICLHMNTYVDSGLSHWLAL
jgi:hypothetical protein